MNKVIILLIFVALYQASAFTVQDITMCAKQNCTTEVQACLADQACNASLPCLALCANSTCTTGCDQALLNDATFWAFETCIVECISELSTANGFTSQCGNQQGSQCFQQFQACQADPICPQATQCLTSCGVNQYTCEGNCYVQYVGNAAFMAVQNCQQDCVAANVQSQ